VSPARKSAKPAAKKAAVSKPAAKKTAPTKPAVTKPPTTKPAAKKPPQSMPYAEGKWAHVFDRRPGEQRFWLVKSEPDVFSYDDLEAAPKRTTCWDSVRNTGARNFLRDGMQVGDLAFYYHSNADPSAIVGICEVVRAGYPDHTAFDPAHDYYDPKSDPDHPTWFMVDVRAVRPLARPVALHEIKAEPALAEMALVRVGRLSVVPVTEAEWRTVLAMSERDAS
jgi:predicted RNA-binding protein with PUA-like domain